MDKIKRAVIGLGQSIVKGFLQASLRATPLFGSAAKGKCKRVRHLYMLLAPLPIDRLATSIVLKRAGLIDKLNDAMLVTIWNLASLRAVWNQWGSKVRSNEVEWHILVFLWDRDPSTLSLFLNKRGAAAILHRIWWAVRGGRQGGLRILSRLSSNQLENRWYRLQEKGYLAERWIRLIVIKVHRAFAGAPVSPLAIVQREVMKTPHLERTITSLARETQVEEAVIRGQMIKELHAMASDFSPSLVRLSRPIFNWVWNKLYSQVVVEGVEPLRELSERGYQLIFLPNHRSHIDYLIVSYVLHKEGLALPYIAAGNNLNFWPAGAFFRRGGGFFIRRSFRGQRLYVALFRAYLRFLLRSGRHLECYVEGGRSRTGYLLEPKTGFLGAVLAEEQELLHRPMAMVPVSLTYDTVPEVAQYYEESRLGKPKPPESGWQMLCGLFRLKRLGAAIVKFGNPLPVSVYRRDATETGGLLALSRKIMENLQRITRVTSSNLLSTTLLTFPMGTAYSSEQIAERWLLLEAVLRDFSRECFSEKLELEATATLNNWATHERIQQDLDAKGDKVYRWDAEQRFQYSYYRNQIQHLFCVPSLMAFLLCRPCTTSKSALLIQFNRLYRVAEHYFFLPREVGDIDLLADSALKIFVKHKWIEPTCEGWYRVSNLSELISLASILESWIAQIGKLAELALRPVEDRYWTEVDRSSWSQCAERFPDGVNLPPMSVFRRILKFWEDQLEFENSWKRSDFEKWANALQILEVRRNEEALAAVNFEE